MEITTLDRVPHRAGDVQRLNAESWPPFLLHGDVRGWSALTASLAGFQILILDGERLAAAGLTAPCAWLGPGDPLPASIDEVVHAAASGMPLPGGALCALAAVVQPEFRRRGLSRRLLLAMRRLAARSGRPGLLVPVRPTEKSAYPRIPMEEYKARRGPDGRLADPWLRTHEELGGTDLGVLAAALRVEGSVTEWEQWTQRVFVESGDHEVDGALVPVRIDRVQDRGEYVEPNVWYFHPSAGGGTPP